MIKVMERKFMANITKLIDKRVNSLLSRLHDKEQDKDTAGEEYDDPLADGTRDNDICEATVLVSLQGLDLYSSEGISGWYPLQIPDAIPAVPPPIRHIRKSIAGIGSVINTIIPGATGDRVSLSSPDKLNLDEFRQSMAAMDEYRITGDEVEYAAIPSDALDVNDQFPVPYIQLRLVAERDGSKPKKPPRKSKPRVETTAAGTFIAHGMAQLPSDDELLEVDGIEAEVPPGICAAPFEFILTVCKYQKHRYAPPSSVVMGYGWSPLSDVISISLPNEVASRTIPYKSIRNPESRLLNLMPSHVYERDCELSLPITIIIPHCTLHHEKFNFSVMAYFEQSGHDLETEQLPCMVEDNCVRVELTRPVCRLVVFILRKQVSKLIGEEGGTLFGPNKSKILVPPGALTEEMEVALEYVGGRMDYPGYDFVSPMFRYFVCTRVPGVVEFEKPITVTLPHCVALPTSDEMYVVCKVDDVGKIRMSNVEAFQVSFETSSMSNVIGVVLEKSDLMSVPMLLQSDAKSDSLCSDCHLSLNSVERTTMHCKFCSKVYCNDCMYINSNRLCACHRCSCISHAICVQLICVKEDDLVHLYILHHCIEADILSKCRGKVLFSESEEDIIVLPQGASISIITTCSGEMKEYSCKIPVNTYDTMVFDMSAGTIGDSSNSPGLTMIGSTAVKEGENGAGVIECKYKTLNNDEVELNIYNSIKYNL